MELMFCKICSIYCPVQILQSISFSHWIFVNVYRFVGVVFFSRVIWSVRMASIRKQCQTSIFTYDCTFITFYTSKVSLCMPLPSLSLRYEMFDTRTFFFSNASIDSGNRWESQSTACWLRLKLFNPWWI